MNIKLDIDALIKKPVFLLALCVFGLVLVYVRYVMPEKYSEIDKFRALYLESEAEKVRIKEQLKQIDAEELEELRPFAQQIVDKENVEAWFKYRDYDSGKWLLLVVNHAYEKEFGISSDLSKGETGFEAYTKQRADLTETELALTLQYQLNDNKAARYRDGCVLFKEWVLPLGNPPEQRNYKKCRMTSGRFLLISGEREL